MRLTALLACFALARRLPPLASSSTPSLPHKRSAAPHQRRPSRSGHCFSSRSQNAAKSRDGYYLDSEKDFHSAANLGVAIRASAMPGLTKKYGADLKSALVGKTSR